MKRTYFMRPGARGPTGGTATEHGVGGVPRRVAPQAPGRVT